MRRLFGFLAITLIPATALFAQQRNSGSSSSSSTSSSSSSSSSSSTSSNSPPSYSPPASSGSSRSYDSGSRSSDSGSRSPSSSSSSSSSSGGGSYTPPSRSSSEPSSRSSSTSTSGSSYHSNPTNNSSGYSNSGNVRDSRNGPQVQNRHEFPTNIPAREPPSSTFRSTEQPTSRGSILPGNNRADVNSGHIGQTSSTTSKMPYDPELLNKYRPKEAKILEKQSRLDEESNKLYTKYKLAGKDAEYERKQAKLDEKRNKLQDKELKLANNYKLEAERKFRPPCRGKDCTNTCPPGTMAGHRGGCVPSPPGNQYPQCGYGYHQDGSQCVQDYQCRSGYNWNGHQCVDEAFNSATNSFGLNCNEYYRRLMEQKKILNNLNQSQKSACAGNAMGAECNSYTQQVSMAETVYRQLQEEYSQCLAHR